MGYLVTFIRLPSLFGALCVGVLIKHTPPLAEILYVDDEWHFIARKLCLVIIIIRWGLGINRTYIRENPVSIVSAISEAIAITLISVNCFNIQLEFGIISGFLLATVSPAICGPVMLKLQERHQGTDKGIPFFVLAACCFDNSFSIVVVTLTTAITFTNDPKFSVFVRNVGEILLCGFIGIFIGWVLWYFPLPNQKHTHTARILLLVFLSIAIILGMNAINHAFPGIVACLLACFVAPTKWRNDNPKKVYTILFSHTSSIISFYLSYILIVRMINFSIILNSIFLKIEPIANFFAILWYYFASPLLFSLVGTLLDFTDTPGVHILAGFVLVVVGILARLVSGFAIVACSPLSLGEQFVVVWSLVPKATVQAALGPNLLVLAKNFPQFKEEATFVVASCIIAVATTAPIGAFVLEMVAPRLVRKAGQQTNRIRAEDSSNRAKTLTSIIEESEKNTAFKRLRALSLQYGNWNGLHNS
ncbi:transporter, CPA2 family [Dictyocaulus viviparus]|uniref:Transporter, CPA2 family n=1 Tax=Dictyocaulus viviparus TaxID=29172 RepID=A0A0D8XC80_DICVI|nr:transporter, CPA2 family [Dictyocaulus viviparus]